MVRSSSGYRARTRDLLKKKQRESGKTGLSKILHSYKENEKICVKIDSSVHKGMPHRRFQGKIGIIKRKQGRSYVVEMLLGNYQKTIIVRPEHIKPFGS